MPDTIVNAQKIITKPTNRQRTSKQKTLGSQTNLRSDTPAPSPALPFFISSYGFRQVISTSAPYFPHMCCQNKISYYMYLILCLTHCSCTINVLSTPSPFTSLYCMQPLLYTLHIITFNYTACS